jgi:hypothetical protein
MFRSPTRSILRNGLRNVEPVRVRGETPSEQIILSLAPFVIHQVNWQARKYLIARLPVRRFTPADMPSRPGQSQSITDEEARRRYSAVSRSVEETETQVALWRAIREGRLAADTDHVQQVLGRVPIGLDQWIPENIPAFLDAATLTATHPPGQP